jgi:hypothetical protein
MVPRAVQVGLSKLKTWLAVQLGDYGTERIISTMLE